MALETGKTRYFGVFGICQKCDFICDYTGCPRHLGFSNDAVVSLFFVLLRVLLCDHKTGRELLLGLILHSFLRIHKEDCLKEEFQNVLILEQYTGCPINKISS